MSGLWEDADLTALMVTGASAALVGGFGLVGRFVDPERGHRVGNVLAAASLTAFSVYFAATDGRRSIWLPALAIAIVFVCCLILQISAVMRRVRTLANWCLRHSIHGLFLVVAGTSLSVWCGFRPGETPASTEKATPRLETLEALKALRPVGSPMALTDKGRRIGLFALRDFVVPAATLDLMEMDLVRERGLSLQMVRCQPPNPDSDCHGWVFADSRWWILGEDVQLILEDNGYESVTDPCRRFGCLPRWPGSDHPLRDRAFGRRRRLGSDRKQMGVAWRLFALARGQSIRRPAILLSQRPQGPSARDPDSRRPTVRREAQAFAGVGHGTASSCHNNSRPCASHLTIFTFG